MSWFDTLQNVADVAFKTPKGEPTKADEDEEKAIMMDKHKTGLCLQVSG